MQNILGEHIPRLPLIVMQIASLGMSCEKCGTTVTNLLILIDIQNPTSRTLRPFFPALYEYFYRCEIGRRFILKSASMYARPDNHLTLLVCDNIRCISLPIFLKRK